MQDSTVRLKPDATSMVAGLKPETMFENQGLLCGLCGLCVDRRPGWYKKMRD
jgi:hypothetical protein